MNRFAKPSLVSFFASSLVIIMLTTPQAFAIVITGAGAALDGTDVGAIDNLRGEITRTDFRDAYGNGGNPDLEEDWAEDVLGTDIIFNDDTKTEGVAWYTTDQSGVIAFELAFGGGFYVVKNAQGRALLENLSEFNWGVLDLSDLTINLNLGDDMVISHVTEDGSTTPIDPGPGVPVPAPLALLGLGGMLLGWRNRKSRA